MQIILAIIAFSKTVKIFKDWIDLFVVTYTANEIKDMKKENRDSIKKAILEQDQRDLEKAMGSTKVGLPSGIQGTEIVDHLPGVK